MRGQLWQNHVATAGLCVSLTTVFNDCQLAAHFSGKQKSLTVFCLALNPPLTRKKVYKKTPKLCIPSPIIQISIVTISKLTIFYIFLYLYKVTPFIFTIKAKVPKHHGTRRKTVCKKGCTMYQTYVAL